MYIFWIWAPFFWTYTYFLDLIRIFFGPRVIKNVEDLPVFFWTLWEYFLWICMNLFWIYGFFFRQLNYIVKMKVRMRPRIPNIPPPQLECGPRTAKNPSVRMPPHPGFKFFCFWRTLCTNPSLRMPPHYEYHQMLECS